ncbi:MAG: glutathione S-transferase N-terminal domain-containing protein [Gammaproteobacteria bacterium]|nr:glutathione S-transferase N-terminal domain-containing protein [Gammaproteobacteria bacterium]
MLTLYHHGSSACAAKVRFAFEEKQLEWEGRYVDLLKGEQFSPEFRALNPKAVVPVLVHDGHVIPESTVICEYVDEVFPERPIYPRDPILRARVRIWTKAVDEELHPACSAITYVVSHRHAILRNGAGDFESFLAAGGSEGLTARRAKWQWIQQGLDAPRVDDKLRIYVGFLERMEQALAASDWLVGERLSMADIAMAPYLYRLAALAMERIWQGGKMPRVEAWFGRIRERDSFAEAFDKWMPPELAADMMKNGRDAWPAVESMLLTER